MQFKIFPEAVARGAAGDASGGDICGKKKRARREGARASCHGRPLARAAWFVLRVSCCGARPLGMTDATPETLSPQPMTPAQHMRAIAVLGLPLILSHVAQFLISLTDALMLG